MKKFIGIGNETPEEILDILNANADGVENMDYFRRATPQELLDANQGYVDLGIKLAVLDDEAEKWKTEHNAKVKPLKVEFNQLLQLVKAKGEIKKGQRVFKMIDQVEGRVGFYAESGELISERPIMEDERQTNIIGSIRAANDSSPI